MNSIINKAYVINLDKRPDRWEDIQLNFSETSLKLTRWSAINGKDLTEDEIKKITTTLCDNICSPSMIGCWLSHFSIWRYIVENNETNVLILEDDAYPVDNFDKLLKEYWQQVPKDWDMVHLGCYGSCDNNILSDCYFKLVSGRKNEPVYKNGKPMKNILKPSCPLALHGYILSNKGARKLLKHPAFQKVSYHVDYVIANNVIGDDFKLYATRPKLIRQNSSTEYSDNQNSNHPLINTVVSNIKFSDSVNLDVVLNTQIAYNRALNISITVLTTILLLISIVIGYTSSINVINWYLYIISLLFFLELNWHKKISKHKVKELIFEALIILSGVFLGQRIKQFMAK